MRPAPVLHFKNVCLHFWDLFKISKQWLFPSPSATSCPNSSTGSFISGVIYLCTPLHLKFLSPFSLYWRRFPVVVLRVSARNLREKQAWSNPAVIVMFQHSFFSCTVPYTSFEFSVTTAPSSVKCSLFTTRHLISIPFVSFHSSSSLFLSRPPHQAWLSVRYYLQLQVFANVANLSNVFFSFLWCTVKNIYCLVAACSLYPTGPF